MNVNTTKMEKQKKTKNKIINKKQKNNINLFFKK